MRRLCKESSRPLSGEICLPGDRRLMSEIRKGFTRKTKNPAYPLAVGG